MDELSNVVEYAHAHDVKVYVTLNTLIKNNEITQLLQLLNDLVKVNVDAVIVQDLGVFWLVNRFFSGLGLHSSTQLTVNNTAGINYLKKLNVEKVVVARENSLEDIRSMAQAGVDLEVFVHGALCICYSGQCLMSSMIGGRSGNRGRCAQPCRLTYTLLDSSGRELGQELGEHLLSPKDLNTWEILPELVDAGAVSLKIEGRMKRAEYVATVVRAYRERLDSIGAGMNDERTAQVESELKQIFNREFTQGYFHTNPGKDLMSYMRPNNRGLQLGRIDKATPHGFAIKLKEELRLGDGIEIWVSKGGRKGFEVSSLEVEGKPVEIASKDTVVSIGYVGRVFPGDRVFKNSDKSLNQKARESYENRELAIREAVEVWIDGKLGEPLTMRIRTEYGEQVTGKTEQMLQEARQHPLDEDIIRKKMRFGNTRYLLGDLNIDLGQNLMIPLSQLNALRRSLTEQLERSNQVEQGYSEHKLGQLERDLFNGIKAKKEQGLLVAEVDDEYQARAAFRSGADLVYIHMNRARNRMEAKPELLGRQERASLYYILPRIIRESEMESLVARLHELKSGCAGFVAPSIGAIELLKSESLGPIHGDYALNVMNNLALQELTDRKLSSVCLSPELSLDEVMAIKSALPLEVIVHGSMPLMTSEHCVVGAVVGEKQGKHCKMPCLQNEYKLNDRKDYDFPLVLQQDCSMQILNARELCVLEEVRALLAGPISRVRLLLRERQDDEIKVICRNYRKIMDNKKLDASEIKKELEKVSPYGLTKGHYFREVE
jgi:putative protease